MFEKARAVIAQMKNKFSGYGEQPVRHPYGEYYQPDVFNNFGEQVIFFTTSGSSGYMEDGKYRDISGARITENEFREVISQAGIENYLEPGALSKAWRGEEL